jgi:hypothetical protein
MCYDVFASSRRGDFFASVLFFRLLQVALMRERVRGGDELSPHFLTCGLQSFSGQIFLLPVPGHARPWECRTGLRTLIGLLRTPPSCHKTEERRAAGRAARGEGSRYQGSP